VFSVNGIALTDNARGWGVLTDSNPLASLTNEVESITIPGRDGVVSIETDTAARFGKLVVDTPATNLEALLALLRSPGASLARTATPSRSIAFECMEASPEPLDTNMTLYEVEFTLRYPYPFMRDTSVGTSAAAALSASTVNVAAFTGLSAVVPDAIVRVKGSATGLRVQDTRGGWFEYSPNIPSGSYLRFHADTGRAWVTTSDVWTGGTEVTGDIDFGGPRGWFEISPKFTDPASREARLDVTTTARSGATIEFRGRAAYLV